MLQHGKRPTITSRHGMVAAAHPLAAAAGARILAKLNLFFGVPRINIQFLPRPLAHLASHFRVSRITASPRSGARAVAAHQNSFEAFILFAVGVLMAHTTQTAGWLIDSLAVIFVIARVLYLLCYWRDLAWQRSLVWVVGLICSLLLMISPTFRTILL